MKEVNIRDHPRRTMKACYDWAKANATARWDVVTIGKLTKPKSINNDTPPHELGAKAMAGDDYTSKLRPPDVERGINWGEFLDEMCKRGGRRNLALLKQFVRVVIAFESDEDAKAFRKWLRAGGDDD